MSVFDPDLVQNSAAADQSCMQTFRRKHVFTFP